VRSIGFRELVTLTAVMMASQALGIDAMLPALPTIGAALGLATPNRAQLIVLWYMVGLGVGQLFWGILSDRYGRRRILLLGLGSYTIAALLCSLSNTFAALLAWRFLHGVAAAAMVIARSVIRDLYSGARMARVMSLTFIVFLISPVLAPSLGQLVLLAAPWRWLFFAIASFGAALWLWTLLRLPETLHPEYRLRLERARVAQALRLVLGHRAALWYTLAITAVLGALLAYVSMVQQIFTDVYHRPRLMPGIFAVCAGAMGVTSWLNARVVERTGMRSISHAALFVLLAASGLHWILALLRVDPLFAFTLLQAVTLACVGLIFANFGTLAMEPMGEVAGLAASLQGFLTALGGALIAALIGRAYQGTIVPLALGSTLAALAAIGCVFIAEEGRMFSDPPSPAGETHAAAPIEPF
jgi:DHA1 family bicyclomycin/chloramphenicol resistance-like MFS transporter